MINVAKEMEHLHHLAVQDQARRFPRLWEKLITEAWLTHAWEAIRRHPGSQTPGIDRQTGNDIDLARIRHLSKRLHAGTYRPHTALRDVARMYPRVSWVIEGDIVGCYDNIPHSGLMKAVARRIADGKVLSLVATFLKAGYLEHRQWHATYSGAPQGGIISPVLCNIFLHQLDAYMESLGANRVQTKREQNLRRSPAYRRIESAIQRARQALRNNPNRRERRQLLDTLPGLEKARQHTPVYDTRHQTKLGYTRYADGTPVQA